MKSLVITVLIVVMWSFSFAQQPDDKITVQDINIGYLEKLIKAEVDSFRITHKLTALQSDTILNLAASDHADYLIKNNAGGHNQHIPAKATPHKRSDYYGAVNYLNGENVAITAIQTPLVRNNRHGNNAIEFIATYKDAARAIFYQWFYSPGHYNNMIKSEYKLTGFGIGVNKEKNIIVVVQHLAWINNLRN